MGWFEILILLLIVLAFIGSMLFWQLRWPAYFVVCGVILVGSVILLVQSPLGDQIRREMAEQEQASRMTRTG